MIAIQTKFLGPTNSRGARVKSFTETGYTATVSWDYSKSGVLAHFEAVKELAKKYDLDWDIENMVYGGIQGGYVFCFEGSKISNVK